MCGAWVEIVRGREYFARADEVTGDDGLEIGASGDGRGGYFVDEVESGPCEPVPGVGFVPLLRCNGSQNRGWEERSDDIKELRLAVAPGCNQKECLLVACGESKEGRPDELRQESLLAEAVFIGTEPLIERFFPDGSERSRVIGDV